MRGAFVIGVVGEVQGSLGQGQGKLGSPRTHRDAPAGYC